MEWPIIMGLVAIDYAIGLIILHIKSTKKGSPLACAKNKLLRFVIYPLLLPICSVIFFTIAITVFATVSIMDDTFH